MTSRASRIGATAAQKVKELEAADRAARRAKINGRHVDDDYDMEPMPGEDYSTPQSEPGDAYEGPPQKPKSKPTAKPIGPKVETFTARELLAMHIPDPRWAVPEILPEGFVVLASKPKLGKSWLALNTGLAVAHGGIALNKIKVEKGSVLYLALEDSKRRLKSRIEILLQKQGGVAPEKLSLAREWPRQHNGGLDRIEEWLTEHPDARLVIIDTWAKFRPPKLRGGNDYDADYAHAAEVKAVADKHEVCILVIHHTTKMAHTDAMDEVSGTLGLTGAADAILVMRRERGRHDAELHITGRDVEESEMALTWDKEYCLWSIAGSAEEFRVGKERQEVIDLIKKENRPLSPSEVAMLLGKKVSGVKSMLWRMSNEELLRTFGDGKYTTMSNPRNSSNQSNQSNPSNHTVADPFRG